MIITLDGIPADYLISANQRIHWTKRARVTRYWRDRAHAAARAAGPLTFDRARITVTFRFPTAHRRDVSNLYPYCVKALVDGCVDAGLLGDDDDTRVIGPDMRRNPEKGPHQIVIQMEEA